MDNEKEVDLATLPDWPKNDIDWVALLVATVDAHNKKLASKDMQILVLTARFAHLREHPPLARCVCGNAVFNCRSCGRRAE